MFNVTKPTNFLNTSAVHFPISYPPANILSHNAPAWGRGCLGRRVSYMNAPEECIGEYPGRFRKMLCGIQNENGDGNRNENGDKMEIQTIEVIDQARNNSIIDLLVIP